MFKKSGINWKSMIRMGITWFWGLGRIDGRKWELEEGATPGNGAYKTFGQTLFHYITHQYAPPQYSIQPFRGLLNTAKQQPWDLDNGVIPLTCLDLLSQVISLLTITRATAHSLRLFSYQVYISGGWWRWHTLQLHFRHLFSRPTLSHQFTPPHMTVKPQMTLLSF